MKVNFIFLITSFCILTSCNDSEEEIIFLSGQVIDAFTQEPVPNVSVMVLEDGPMAVTDANGSFRFKNEEISMVEEIEGSGDFAVALSHEDYRPREANVPRGSGMKLEIAPAEVPAYFYNPPVQLNDGLLTGSLEDANMDRQLIQDLMDRLYRDTYNEVHSILVYKDDKLVLEEYFFGNNDTIQFENDIKVDRTLDPIQWSRTQKHYVASVNKALTSTVVGIAMDQYGVSAEDKIANHLPEYSSYFEDPNKAAIDFEDCLNMTAGFQWDEWGSNDLALLWKSGDFADFVLERPNPGPGWEWRYNSALPNVLLKAVDNMVDGQVREWAHENFYQKLDITDYNWQSQPDGFPEGAARMFIRPRDMLKIGVTYLNNGVWDGTQVIPQSWVRECFEVKEETAAGNYSNYFWIRNLADTEYLSADGDGGNYINIFPSHNMVIVITQGLYLKWPSYVNQADDMMGNYIIPAVE